MLWNRTSKNPALQAKIEQLALPLAPLVQITTGEVSDVFPTTLLKYWVLVESEIDELAHFYHQRTPSELTKYYPKPINDWRESLTLEEKRRKLGKFIGLRGCETPVTVKNKTEEEIWEEARRARLGEEEEIWRKKMAWY
jgi:hypothetical protein